MISSRSTTSSVTKCTTFCCQRRIFRNWRLRTSISLLQQPSGSSRHVTSLLVACAPSLSSLSMSRMRSANERTRFRAGCASKTYNRSSRVSPYEESCSEILLHTSLNSEACNKNDQIWHRHQARAKYIFSWNKFGGRYYVNQADTRRNSNVIMTSKRRRDVVLTS